MQDTPKPPDKARKGAVVVRGRPRSPGREPDRLATLDTALELLKIIARHEGRTSLTLLSQLSGEPPNKLHRYLATLKHHGFLVQSATTGLYDIGPESHTLGLSALRRYDPMTGVQAAMTEVAQRTGYSCNLYVWTPLGPTLIMHEPGAQAFPVVLKLGTALPLAESATGIVFLELMPEEATAPILAQQMQSAEGEGLTIPMDYIRAETAKVRAGGVYWTSRAVITGTAAVLPILGSDGTLACTITTILPRGHATPEARAHLEETMMEVQARLSGSPSSSDVARAAGEAAGKAAGEGAA